MFPNIKLLNVVVHLALGVFQAYKCCKLCCFHCKLSLGAACPACVSVTSYLSHCRFQEREILQITRRCSTSASPLILCSPASPPADTILNFSFSRHHPYHHCTDQFL
uniref:Secreted protein n=1 Tax=Helianthus annuus TaxID=4232 RepID=A0A251UPT1_HELAN